MRIISNDAQEALDSGRFSVRCLLKVRMDEGDPFAIWDDVGTIEVNEDVYSGAAGRFTVQTTTSVKDLSIQNLDITLSGLDAEVTNLIDGAGWHQRPIEITRAIIATESPTIFSLMPEFSGFLDQMFWTERPGDTSTMRFRAESASREFNRAGARTRSPADQRQRDSSDGFFDWATAAVSGTIVWGQNPQQASSLSKPKKSGLTKFLDKLF